MDEVQVRAINNANGKNLPETPTLLFEFIGTGELGSVICLDCHFLFPLISWQLHFSFCVLVPIQH